MIKIFRKNHDFSNHKSEAIIFKRILRSNSLEATPEKDNTQAMVFTPHGKEYLYLSYAMFFLHGVTSVALFIVFIKNFICDGSTEAFYISTILTVMSFCILSAIAVLIIGMQKNKTWQYWIVMCSEVLLLREAVWNMSFGFGRIYSFSKKSISIFERVKCGNKWNIAIKTREGQVFYIISQRPRFSGVEESDGNAIWAELTNWLS